MSQINSPIVNNNPSSITLLWPKPINGETQKHTNNYTIALKMHSLMNALKEILKAITQRYELIWECCHIFLIWGSLWVEEENGVEDGGGRGEGVSTDATTHRKCLTDDSRSYTHSPFLSICFF